MASWIVYIEYNGECLEVEIEGFDLETEDEVYQEVMGNMQVWAEMVENE